MTKAGFCASCGTNVWLAEDGSCQSGHPADQISGVYEADVQKDSLSEAGEAIEDAAKEAAGAAMSFGKKLFGSEESEGPTGEGGVDSGDEPPAEG